MTVLAPLRILWRRKPLLWALGVGAAVGGALSAIPNDIAAPTRLLAGWDAALLAYLAALAAMMRGADARTMQAHAAETDQGRHFVLAASVLTVAASLVAVGAELGAAHNAAAAPRVTFAFATVALSWLFMHAAFAVHYAHEFHGPAPGGGVRGGLAFPGEEAPDFWDFLHFALVIGVAAQTADIQITGRPIRRVVTVHGVAAFVFNTVVLALTLNVLAGLFQ